MKLSDNVKSVTLSAAVARSAGTANGTKCLVNGLAERALIMVDVGTVASGGTVDVVIKGGSDGSTFGTTLATFTQITATGNATMDVAITTKYIRAEVVTATAAVTSSVTAHFYNLRDTSVNDIVVA